MIDKFIAHCTKNHPKYQVWGDFIVSTICEGLQSKDLDLTGFLKIPPKVRVKEISSIRGKAALYNIDDPFNEIIDVVGVRFVVLLTTDIDLIQQCIEENINWNARKIRDFEEGKLRNPELFDYQSMHYCLSPAKNIVIGEMEITPDYFCEVQIRTILQHAYAELTHDNIYKPIKEVSKKAKRIVARSMALMESTDHLFCQTMEELQAENIPRNNFYNSLSRLYSELVVSSELSFSENFNYEIIEIYGDLIGLKDGFDSLAAYWVNNASMLPKLASYSNGHFLFKQPISLFLYWLVENHNYETLSRWSYGSLREELRLIYSATGTAIGDNL